MVRRTGFDVVDNDVALRIRLDVMAFVLVLLVIFMRHDWMTDAGTHPDPYSRIFVAVSTAIQFIERAHPDAAPIASAIMGDLKSVVHANRAYLSLSMFFAPMLVQLERDKYNDLLSRVSAEVPHIRAHSFFDEAGLLRA
jgi:hypothetical protein